MVATLRERNWEGDDVLADQLEALLGSGVIPDLRPLPADLDELADILEGDPIYAGGRIDLATGEVWPAPAVDYAREIGQEGADESDDPDKWLWVHCEGSRDGYRDIELFIGTVGNPDRADRLEIAISGRGAFRRFKDVLARWPAELPAVEAFSASASVAGHGPGSPTPATTSAKEPRLHDLASQTGLRVRARELMAKYSIDQAVLATRAEQSGHRLTIASHRDRCRHIAAAFRTGWLERHRKGRADQTRSQIKATSSRQTNCSTSPATRCRDSRRSAAASRCMSSGP